MSDDESPAKKTRVSEEPSTEDVEQQWREVFRIFDRDENGSVSASELGALLRGLGYNPSMAQVEKILREIDYNGTGVIEWEEFREYMRGMKKSGFQEQRREMTRAFEIFDYNGDGFIDAKELKKVMTTTGEKLSDEEVQHMISVADVNKDGRINYQEFVNFIFSEGS
ncbi:neo-calmodulin-like isoform X2 [Babylonia areolata]|uniref:neo-calmodulin-like isoform X2 n=1 Tax=Babylonia areolata TaxID=304850 RepID=UPI003FD69A0E